MLEPLIETTREEEKDKYSPNDRLPDSTNPTNLFSKIPRKKDWVFGETEREEKRQATEKKWGEVKNT